VLDNTDMLIEARQTHMEESAATGAYAPLLELVASPFRATVIQQLS
jgi:hypothetical protein